MATFRTLSIHHKLIAVTGLLVVGFAGVGGAYLHLGGVHEAVATRTAALNAVAMTADLVSTKTLESELLLRDFLRRGQASIGQQCATTLADAAHAADTLATRAAATPMQGMSAQLADAVKAYQRAAQSTIDLMAVIGLEETSGLRGTVHTAALAMDQLLDTLTAPGSATAQEAAALARWWVTVRQHEKAFVTSGKEGDAGNLSVAKRTLHDAGQAGSYLPETKAQLSALLETYYQAFLRLAERVKQRERSLVQLEQRQRFATPLIAAIGAATQREIAANYQHGQEQTARSQRVFSVVLVLGASAAITALVLVGLHLTRTMRHLHRTVEQCSAGDVEARTGMQPGDELGDFGRAFDALLDERAQRLTEAQQQHEALNGAIIDLIYAVALLSQRDLTVRLPVGEDITAPVADALNYLIDETVTVLATVTQVADQVAVASQEVSQQADTVRSLAETEQRQVSNTALRLATATTAMQQIASLAQTCDAEAAQASAKTHQALAAVTDTVESIHAVHDTMQETERRLKRLGERAQDISGAVSLVNGIADRTHILAINANMHAAAAGEAGRGFAVVAAEVQRLADNARQSTEQIAQLLGDVQAETLETVAMMNTMIGQVRDGRRLAGQASEQMQHTQQSTATLVASVHAIAAEAQEQASVSTLLREQAQVMVASTQDMRIQLSAQSVQTAQLLAYAQKLVQAVHVFKLPPPPLAVEVPVDQMPLEAA